MRIVFLLLAVFLLACSSGEDIVFRLKSELQKKEFLRDSLEMEFKSKLSEFQNTNDSVVNTSFRKDRMSIWKLEAEISLLKDSIFLYSK